MKKIILGSLFLISSLFSDINITDVKTIDKIGLSSLNSKIPTLDENKDNLSIWYLRNFNKAKFNKVKEDEFELDDAKIQAFNTFTEKIKSTKSFIGTTGSVRINISFGKYDFKNKQFPLDAMNKNSYLTFYGENMTYRLEMSFNNVNPSKNVLPMEKTKARELVKIKKGKYGNVDRDLTGLYYYKITDVESTLAKESLNCTLTSYSCTPKLVSNLKLKTDITKLEILDSDGTVLYTYEQY